MVGSGAGCDVDVAQVEAVVEPDSVADDVGSAQLGIGDACMCSYTDSINTGPLTWQYPLSTFVKPLDH